MIATVPGATDICICGHNGLAHDATSQVCRYSKDPAAPCGCSSFGRPGTLGNHPPVTNAPPLNGPAQGPASAAADKLAGNRNG